METADDNTNRLNSLQKYFKQLSYYTASNWLLYLDATGISNQIKYYFTKNRGNLLEIQYGFYMYDLLADLIWVVVKRAFTKYSRKAGMWLFGTSLWKTIKALWLANFSRNFCLLTGEAGIVNVQGCGMRWYLSWPASSLADTDPGAIPNPFESLQKFQGRSAFWFTYIDELKIKYFSKLYFSKTLMFTGFFVFFH